MLDSGSHFKIFTQEIVLQNMSIEIVDTLQCDMYYEDITRIKHKFLFQVPIITYVFNKISSRYAYLKILQMPKNSNTQFLSFLMF